MVSFPHGQSMISSQTQLDNIVHEQTIICRQLFTGHLVGAQCSEHVNSRVSSVTMIV